VKLGYRPALDGLRAVAISAVVLYHASDFRYPASGLLGVDLFFVLSGFLITTLLLEEHRRRGVVSLGAFYQRRARRLLPALFILVGAFLVIWIMVAALGGTAPASVLLGVVAGLMYVTNFILASGHVDRLPFALTHLWSLAEEEQFYLLWPPILFFLFRARLGVAIAACGAGVVLTQLRALELLHDGATSHRVAFGMDTRSLPILVGCLLALLLATRARRFLARSARWLVPVAIPLFVALLVIKWDDALFEGPLLASALCAAVLIQRALDSDSWVARTLSTAPTVFLGRISYSLYLWHVPIFVAFGIFGAGVSLMAIPAIALSVAAAVASYYLVEQPFLRHEREPRRHKSLQPKPEPLPRARLQLEEALQLVPSVRGARITKVRAGGEALARVLPD
jgi:peptidoglycan/LPS O-acetylase OafA/YrhL